MLILWILGAGALAALVARFYFGVTIERAAMYVAMRTVVGQMMHDMSVSKTRALQHSKPAIHDCGSFLVRVVSFLEDNFAYIVVDKATGRTAIVDPGDGERCLAHVKDLQIQYDELRATRAAQQAPTLSPADRRSVDRTLIGQLQCRPELTTALVTHHHLDHAGGLPALRAAVPELRVIAGQKEAVPGTNAPATHGARVWLGATEVDVLAAPCHTRGHVLFHVHGPTAKRGGPPPVGAGARGFAGSGALFTGDTLFVGGCGRFFEGGAEDMHYVLYTVLRPLPAETPVFCGHEYTVDNLRFALWVDAGNRDVQEKLAWALRMRADGQATVPSLLSEERAYNPFMRVHVPAIRAAVAEATRATRGGGQHEPLAEVPALAGLRALKNAKAHLAAGAQGAPPGGGGPLLPGLGPEGDVAGKRTPYADL